LKDTLQIKILRFGVIFLRICFDVWIKHPVFEDCCQCNANSNFDSYTTGYRQGVLPAMTCYGLPSEARQEERSPETGILQLFSPN